MGLKHYEYLSGEKVYGCHKCRTHLTTKDQLESKASRHVQRTALCSLKRGQLELYRPTWSRLFVHFSVSLTYATCPVITDRAYSRACRWYSVNVTLGPPEDRAMTTGLHTVRDVSCEKCSQVLGWKYGQSRHSLLSRVCALADIADITDVNDNRQGVRLEPEVQGRQIHPREGHVQSVLCPFWPSHSFSH